MGDTTKTEARRVHSVLRMSGARVSHPLLIAWTHFPVPEGRVGWENPL